MALYDVTAAIDYALSTTGNTEVYYVGFSMGTTIFFALMSEKPQYAAKIKAAALMGPVAYVENIKGPLRLLADYSNDLDTLFGLMGQYEFLPSGPEMDYLAQNFCGVDDKLSPVCENILFLISGFDEVELNKEYVPIYLSHTPAGTSIHTVNHYGQLVLKGVFQMYDWGRIGNEKHYGQGEPPMYNLHVDTPPIALYWGQNDWLADPKDVARLSSELKNVVVNQRVEHDQWNHMDFVWGIHAKEYVYEYLINFLSKY
ncbi:Lipase 3 [Armadillidium nasatum]|uniref:Lipase 3 n=1 Tax=Armadillidium nasatum TaxID=96803 RepID=A0A5N5T727_9CRUS|nr:Lipase 3 [Armadillidium nasatum]